MIAVHCRHVRRNTKLVLPAYLSSPLGLFIPLSRTIASQHTRTKNTIQKKPKGQIRRKRSKHNGIEYHRSAGKRKRNLYVQQIQNRSDYRGKPKSEKTDRKIRMVSSAEKKRTTIDDDDDEIGC